MPALKSPPEPGWDPATHVTVVNLYGGAKVGRLFRRTRRTQMFSLT
jgi:hypothetical protein